MLCDRIGLEHRVSLIEETGSYRVGGCGEKCGVSGSVTRKEPAQSRCATGQQVVCEFLTSCRKDFTNKSRSLRKYSW